MTQVIKMNTESGPIYVGGPVFYDQPPAFEDHRLDPDPGDSDHVPSALTFHTEGSRYILGSDGRFHVIDHSGLDVADSDRLDLFEKAILETGNDVMINYAAPRIGDIRALTAEAQLRQSEQQGSL